MGLSRKEALDCFASDDLIGIGMEADAVRRRLHPEGVVTYGIDGSIDTTEALESDGFEQIFLKAARIVDLGGTSITLHGSPTQDHTLEWYEGLFRAMKRRFPDLWLHSLSATEIFALIGRSGVSLEGGLRRLRDAGLDSIPGEDAGILDEAVQQESQGRCTPADWIAVHRAAHGLGLQTTTSMIFGAGETAEHRLNHLERLRQLQEETGGFASFTPSASLPRSARTPGFEEATAVEYLKTLAISRLYLDGIANLQSDLATQGLKVLQVGLRFGGNDVGRVLWDGPHAASEEQLRQVIRDAGFHPVQRDILCRTMFLN